MFQPMQLYRDGKRVGRAESLESVAIRSRREFGSLFEVYQAFVRIAVFCDGARLS